MTLKIFIVKCLIFDKHSKYALRLKAFPSNPKNRFNTDDVNCILYLLTKYEIHLQKNMKMHEYPYSNLL